MTEIEKVRDAMLSAVNAVCRVDRKSCGNAKVEVSELNGRSVVRVSDVAFLGAMVESITRAVPPGYDYVVCAEVEVEAHVVFVVFREEDWSK